MIGLIWMIRDDTSLLVYWLRLCGLTYLGCLISNSVYGN